ncbi:prephenate dehydrogenase [Corynebacterium terpenotabidum]|uniref:Prephenate dehydrogenase n=1 Tax=Corynebacterium terpenotabidum Y-11 TaxID=1200352 RepID=S4XJ75_9CORY|nr:prephenate dehydrogenase [Corynebacterium terpenotabidum]AGP31805.1 prephenate dehydrogenase [Corynebacterium terpenotabidum Y-11]
MDHSGPVCVLGLGLIGGSLLRDLVAAGTSAFGWNRSTATVDAAIADGFDVSGDLVATLRRAEKEDALIVLGVPVPALPTMLSAVAEHAPSCGITDVTSVKGEVLSLVEDHGLSDRFVGGHPMAGTADSGWDATMEGLFRGAVWVVTTDGAPELPDETVDATWLRIWCRVVHLAVGVGAAVVPARSAAHDGAVARISHLTHVLAESLAVTADRGGALSLSLAASSFRDATRVAGTEPGLVRAMCENNRDALVTALDETISLLQQARADLAAPDRDIAGLVDAGHAARLRYEALAGRVAGEPSARPYIRLQPGVSGWLEQLHYAESVGAQIALLEV